jgi:hypothetical protein
VNGQLPNKRLKLSHSPIWFQLANVRVAILDRATRRLGRSTATSPSNAFHYDWILRARILSGHSLMQRTETAICFWPWGPR